MGKEIVYCGGCGKILPESEFARGRAHTVDHSAYCTSCRPAGSVTPRSLLRVAAAAAPKSSPLPAAPAPTRFTRKRIAILAGTGAAVLASFAVLLLIVGNGGAPPAAAMVPAEPPPPADPAPRVLRELESFAASSGDAETILARCVEARPALVGRPEEPALRKIEDRARRGIEERERLERLRIELETKKARETAAAPPPPVPVPAQSAPTPPVNLPPTVALASPRDGSTFVSPAMVTLVAEASDPDGRVARVEFFLEIVKLGEATQPPYSFTKAIALPGTYVLSAKAIDDAGAETSSGPVTITVTAEKEKKRGPFKGEVASVPGTIRAADYDEGGEGVAYHLLSPGPKDGPPRAGDGDSGTIAMKPTEWLEYSIRVPASGTYAIEVQVSSKGPGGLFHVEFGKADKTGPLAVLETGGDRAWKSVSKQPVVLELGEQAMRLVMDKAGPSGIVGSFHSIRISECPAPVALKSEPVKADPRKAARPDPLQIKVDEAVRKGLEHLKGLPNIHPQYKEIVLLTYLHAGVPENDPQLQALLKESLAFKADGYSARTYNISLLAMALEELDRVTYQKDLARCAQFLIDNECRNGQWGYGAPTVYPKDFPAGPTRGVATPSKSKPPAGARAPNAISAVRVKPPVRSTLKVKPQKEGPDHGDDSNSQYAALGLRACHEAGILLPKESIERARKWWVEFQEPEDPKKKESRDVATGAGIGTPRGWGYLSDGKLPAPGYYGSTGSMTAGAVGAVCIYDFILGLDWKRDPSVRDGMAWMAEHFTVKGNPGKETPPVPRADWHYYYLYALERVGMLVPTQHIGRADWYLEGAKHLVEAQLPDGSWNQSTYHNSPAAALDTCYAILFLRRVTRPLQDVATVDPFRKP